MNQDNLWPTSETAFASVSLCILMRYSDTADTVASSKLALLLHPSTYGFVVLENHMLA